MPPSGHPQQMLSQPRNRMIPVNHRMVFYSDDSKRLREMNRIEWNFITRHGIALCPCKTPRIPILDNSAFRDSAFCYPRFLYVSIRFCRERAARCIPHSVSRIQNKQNAMHKKYLRLSSTHHPNSMPGKLVRSFVVCFLETDIFIVCFIVCLLGCWSVHSFIAGSGASKTAA